MQSEQVVTSKSPSTQNIGIGIFLIGLVVMGLGTYLLLGPGSSGSTIWKSEQQAFFIDLQTNSSEPTEFDATRAVLNQIDAANGKVIIAWPVSVTEQELAALPNGAQWLFRASNNGEYVLTAQAVDTMAEVIAGDYAFDDTVPLYDSREYYEAMPSRLAVFFGAAVLFSGFFIAVIGAYQMGKSS